MKYYPGYMALTTTIIIVVVLMLIVASVSFSALFSRLGSQSATAKQQSLYATHACLDQARLNLALNNQYTGNETFSISLVNQSVSCTIMPITTSGTQKILRATATLKDTTTNSQLTVDGSTLQAVSLIQVKSF